jgi:uncharacterized protein (DUF2062 family)
LRNECGDMEISVDELRELIKRMALSELWTDVLLVFNISSITKTVKELSLIYAGITFLLLYLHL